MAIQDDNTVVTKGDLKNLYANKIAPYLGANVQLSIGAGDYYDATERIVGVWLGKPLYQKIITGTTPSSSREITISGFSNIDFIYIDKFLVSNGTYRTNLSYDGIWVDIKENGSEIYCKVTDTALWANKAFTAVICYTKSTDTANSAATTVGCYDPTRPDQWLENTEIYFGNGLYGYRATGAMNMPKQTHSNVNCGVTATKFVNQGGHWTANDSYDYPFGCTWSGNGSSTIAWIDRSDSNQLKLAFWPDTNLTNATYDVWVLYRK